MKPRILYCWITIMLMTSFKLSAQVNSEEIAHKAPTLQIGLDGILFKKGDLDAQIIMQMVADAQRHVALKAVQNMFLSKLELSGGATFSFADNVIKNIIEEKDTEIRTKRIFEHTINIVFTYAFLEYYIETLKARGKETIFSNMLTEFKANSVTIPYSLKKLKGNQREPQNKFYNNENEYDLIATLMDMSSLAIGQDIKLKDLGLMQVSHSSSYQYLNKYNILSIDATSQKFTATQIVYTDMVNCLENLTKMIGLVKYLVTEKSFRNDQINLVAAITAIAPPALANITTALSTEMSNLTTTYNNLVSSSADSALQADLYTIANDISLLKKAIRIIQTSTTLGSIDYNILSDFLYTLTYDIIPGLKKMSYRNASLRNISENLTDVTLLLAKHMEVNVPGANQLGTRVYRFVQLLSRLYEFNSTSTFAEYTKIITDLETIFPNDFANEALSIINTFIKDHVQFVKNEEGKEMLDFKVESFIRKLSEIKPYRYSPFKFNMTVGVNSGFFKNAIPIDGTNINNFSFVGEKIGLKLKILDWDFWQTRNPGETYSILGTPYIKTGPPKQPLISDVHLLAYGSGLLYNIINSSTSNNFNGSLIGIGIGATFTRLLDVNLSYCLPIVKGIGYKQSFDYGYYGIGFDVQFGAYLDRLSQKRSQNKIQKNAVMLSNN